MLKFFIKDELMFYTMGVTYTTECKVQQFPFTVVFFIDFRNGKFGGNFILPNHRIECNPVPNDGGIIK